MIKNLALMSYCFHGLLNVGAMNVFGYLETVKYRYGLDTADLWNGFFDSYDPCYVDLIKQNIDERGLHVVNFACDMAHVWDDDPETMKQNEQTAWKCIDAAERLSAKSVRIDAGIREDWMSAKKLDYVSKKYREYCARAAEFGASLGTENHWGATKVADNIERLFEAVDADNFGLLLHLGRWNDADPAIRERNDLKLINKTMHLHINRETCLDAARLLPPLVKAGYGGCWSVEAGDSSDEYNTAAIMLAHVKNALCPLDYDGAWKDGPPSVNG